MSKIMTKKPHVPNLTVAEYLERQIDLITKSKIKTQSEIAQDLGYDKPNIITMFKQGRTKLPFPKVIPLARSIGVDPVHLLRVVLSEYSPETWEVLEQIIGQSMISEGERETLKIIREAAGEVEAVPKTDQEVNELKDLVSKWRKRESAPVTRHH